MATVPDLQVNVRVTEQKDDDYRHDVLVAHIYCAAAMAAAPNWIALAAAAACTWNIVRAFRGMK